MKRAHFRSPVWPLGLLGIAAAIAVSIALVATASNTVPYTVAGSVSTPVTASELAPSGCGNAAGLTAVVLGSNVPLAIVQGTSANELILAGANGQTLGLAVGGGSDCCVGNSSNTTVFLASCTYGLDK